MIAFLRNLFLHDFWLKLFSVVLATLIWITVFLAIQKEVSPVAPLALAHEKHTFFNLPVLVLMSSASDLPAVKVIPSEVEVTVQGDPRALQQLNPRDLHATVDLSDIESARDLRKRVDLTMPPGITRVRVAPEEVQIIVSPRK